MTDYDKHIDSIAKRVYPLTEKEKNCINEFGKLIMKRGNTTNTLKVTVYNTVVDL